MIEVNNNSYMSGMLYRPFCGLDPFLSLRGCRKQEFFALLKCHFESQTWESQNKIALWIMMTRLVDQVELRTFLLSHSEPTQKINDPQIILAGCLVYHLLVTL